MIADTSQHVYSFNGYVYGEKVAELREEVASKLNVTNAAGLNGKKIGENFQDVKRLTVGGMLSEDSDENTALGVNALPLRAIVQRFRFAHRSELGKKKLVLHSAADSRPAEYVLAAVEAVTGLRWEAPMIETEFEISFVAEPEIYYDDLRTYNLILDPGSVAGDDITYVTDVLYVGPDSDFYADCEGLPLLKLTVTGFDNSTSTPYVEIGNTLVNIPFRLYPDGNHTFFIDSYEEGIRKGSTWAGGTVFEAADYDQFLFLNGDALPGGVTNTLAVFCHFCDLSEATLTYYPRHW